MIRVGFLLNLNDGWLGGLNYYRNLLQAICDNKESRILPIIITSKKFDRSVFQGFPDVEIITTKILDRFNPFWAVQRAGQKYLSKDFFLERLLLSYDISILSHSYQIGMNSIPVCGWIPDFQHIHYPEYFTKKEINDRDREFAIICETSTKIILSSFAAQKDLASFAPEYVNKSRVLKFVVPTPQFTNKMERGTLEQRYHFKGNYLHVPNQFWIHKNHKLIIEALRIAKSKGRCIHIIATGNTTDYRQPRYYSQLIELANKYGVINSFQVLGTVPYSDLVALMNNSVAIINPSLFEGWSTTVEEAKSLGKKILLSNIDVHREQNPERGIFFDPANPEELEELMWQAIVDYNEEDEEYMRKKALEDISQRWFQFAKTYEDIILDTCVNRN